MEPKQSSASPASAGKIVNLSGKHAGTLIKDTPAFPEGASPDVFRKNSRAVKKWLKNASEYFSLQYAQMIALVIIKTLVNPRSRITDMKYLIFRQLVLSRPSEL